MHVERRTRRRACLESTAGGPHTSADAAQEGGREALAATARACSSEARDRCPFDFSSRDAEARRAASAVHERTSDHASSSMAREKEPTGGEGRGGGGGAGGCARSSMAKVKHPRAGAGARESDAGEGDAETASAEEGAGQTSGMGIEGPADRAGVPLQARPLERARRRRAPLPGGTREGEGEGQASTSAQGKEGTTHEDARAHGEGKGTTSPIETAAAEAARGAHGDDNDEAGEQQGTGGGAARGVLEHANEGEALAGEGRTRHEGISHE